jgi:predicted NBD/HSP70 family sugar kinase
VDGFDTAGQDRVSFSTKGAAERGRGTVTNVVSGPAVEAGGVRTANAAAVLRVVRDHGPLPRGVIGSRTSLSAPTVSRQVATLVGLGLLREFPDRRRFGGIGRPGMLVDINDDLVAACGVHVGVTTTTYGLTTLRGRLLGSERIPTPTGRAENALAHIAGKVRGFLGRWPARRVIGLGFATGGRVDDRRGTVAHERLGWGGAPVRSVLEDTTGLPVFLDGHVPAMATAELLFGEAIGAESVLYFYARQVVGIAVAVRGRLHRGPSGAGTIAHLGVGGDVRCRCGRVGCLEATVAERTVVEQAVARGVIEAPEIGLLRAAADAGDEAAVGILRQRARALGTAVGIVRDTLDPELVVLGGQAITEAPGQLGDLLDAFATSTTLPGTELIRVTRFGPDVQAVAACTGLLSQVYDNPTALVPAAS